MLRPPYYTSEVACSPCNRILSIYDLVCPKCGVRAYLMTIKVTPLRRTLLDVLFFNHPCTKEVYPRHRNA